MSGIGRTGPGGANPVGGATGGGPAPKVTEYPFNAFAPNTIKPDGDAFVAEGPLNRYAHATVRGSGDGVSVTIRERSSPEQASRAATAGELKELEGALEAYVRQGRGADYAKLLEHVRAAQR